MDSDDNLNVAGERAQIGSDDDASLAQSEKTARGDKQQDKKKRKLKVVVFYILSTFNNNIITMADMKGDVIAWSSSGMHGFKGSRKSTSHAAQVTAEHLIKIAQKMNVTGAHIYVRGIGNGRDAAVKALGKTDIEIFMLSFNSYVPHNGVKPRKQRRM